MAKFRKKPIVVEAFQWDGEYLDGFQVLESNPPQLVIHTLEGDMCAQVGDWIITGVKGEIYPCKFDIFEATYEPVEEGDGDEENTPVYPSVGETVYYYAYGTPKGEFPANVARAAIITEVDDPESPESPIGLAVLNPTGLFFNRNIPHGPGKAGHWGWTWEEV